MVLVSVLTTAYNAEKYLSASIQSILNQSYKEIEYVVYDDCSTDSTFKVMMDFQAKDKRIIAIKGEKKLSIPECRNKLIHLAKGKYIAWQDADDISMPYRIAEQVALMESKPDIGICGGYLEFISHTGQSTSMRMYHTDDRELRRHIFRYSPVAQPAAMIRRSLFQVVGDYNKKYFVSQDLDMSFRIGQVSKFANVPRVLVQYREHDQSISMNKLKFQLRYTLDIRSIYWYSHSYAPNILDGIYYFATFVMMALPKRIANQAFKLLRNTS